MKENNYQLCYNSELSSCPGIEKGRDLICDYTQMQLATPNKINYQDDVQSTFNSSNCYLIFDCGDWRSVEVSIATVTEV